jgi:Na+-driven multidrug efflux pump
MLMQMMSNGGIGGGFSSAVARALGANRHADADALVWHAIVLACAFGLIFTAAAFLGGPILYRAMGGEGPTLTAALTYSGVVFAGSIPIWITALLSSALRGAGNVNVPALVILSGAVILVPLSPTYDVDRGHSAPRAPAQVPARAGSKRAACPTTAAECRRRADPK